MDRKKYSIILFALLVVTGCQKDNPTAMVGDYVTVSADIPKESQDLDFIWELTSVPDNSAMDNSQVTAGESSASVVFIPDVPGTYSLEVSVFQYNDEISTQSFNFEVAEGEIVAESEDVVTVNENEEVEDAVAELMAESDEPKWYDSESASEVIEAAKQTTTEPAVEVEEVVEKTLPPPPPPAPKKKKAKPARGASIPFDKERFTIQVASKKVLEDAKKVAVILIDSGYDAYIQKAVFKETNEVWYRVRVGSYDKRETAVAVAKSMSSTRQEKAWVDHVRYEY
ncbi:MAG: SPOR domain-containing protein [Candidatus Marinimicrobia bacterium]|nr:SPOR domain-containing protein [Candidatus Neomarinimicrobiota bacterium]